MYIPAQLQQIAVSIYKYRLITSLEKMTASFVFPVEIYRVGSVKPLHEFLQVGFQRLYNEMKVVDHQNISMHFNIVQLYA